jgi:hypothetical protein
MFPTKAVASSNEPVRPLFAVIPVELRRPQGTVLRRTAYPGNLRWEFCQRRDCRKYRLQRLYRFFNAT